MTYDNNNTLMYFNSTLMAVIFYNPFIDESVVFEGFEIIEAIVAVKLCMILGSSPCPQSVLSAHAMFMCPLPVCIPRTLWQCVLPGLLPIFHSWTDFDEFFVMYSFQKRIAFFSTTTMT